MLCWLYIKYGQQVKLLIFSKSSEVNHGYEQRGIVPLTLHCSFPGLSILDTYRKSNLLPRNTRHHMPILSCHFSAPCNPSINTSSPQSVAFVKEYLQGLQLKHPALIFMLQSTPETRSLQPSDIGYNVHPPLQCPYLRALNPQPRPLSQPSLHKCTEPTLQIPRTAT